MVKGITTKENGKIDKKIVKSKLHKKLVIDLIGGSYKPIQLT